MSSFVDNLKQRKAAMISPLAFILAACGGGSSNKSSISDIDLTGSTNDDSGGVRSSDPTFNLSGNLKDNPIGKHSTLFEITLKSSLKRLLEFVQP